MENFIYMVSFSSIGREEFKIPKQLLYITNIKPTKEQLKELEIFDNCWEGERKILCEEFKIITHEKFIYDEAKKGNHLILSYDKKHRWDNTEHRLK